MFENIEPVSCGKSVGQLSFALMIDGRRNETKARGRSCETKATVAEVKRGRGNSVETDRATENVLPRLTYRNHARQIVKTTGNPLFRTTVRCCSGRRSRGSHVAER